MIPQSLDSLEQQRAAIALEIASLGDLRCGSITATGGRCGKSNCHCHQPGDPGHSSHLRLTYKLGGKSVTESLPDPAAVRKAETEIAEFRKFDDLRKRFLAVNAEICRLRPTDEALTPQEKKRPKRPAGKRRAK
jgi:hypothetical protein